MNHLIKVFATIQRYGVSGLAWKIYRKFFPTEFEREITISSFEQLEPHFIGRIGLEIGGPSRIFQKHIPLYPLVAGLDCCNYSGSTVWEGTIRPGANFNFGGRTGYQYLSEASELSMIENEKYDFVVSSNCLEHVANPIKALEEWKRVVKPGGAILLLVPNKKYCFDHDRPFTHFEHLLQDYRSGVNENDLTHLGEILKLHDLEMDKAAGTAEQFKARSLNNFDNRCLHHHVFSIPVIERMFQFIGMTCLFSRSAENLIVLAQKK